MNLFAKKIRDRLVAMQDKEYKKFVSSLIPSVNSDRIIGIRAPILRALAKEIDAYPADARDSLRPALLFMGELPHLYLEENNLHAYLIEKIRDYDQCIEAINRFLPYVDNWSTSDSMRPKVFRTHTKPLFEQIQLWIRDPHPYTIRFGIEMLMTYYLDEHFSPAHLRIVATVRSQEYYVNMMVAWYFATALAKQYEAAIEVIRNELLDDFTHNKSIQKAVESYRVSDEHKKELRMLKRKNQNVAK